MPKGPKSIGVLCAELGMDAAAEKEFRKDALSYLKARLVDLPNATDAEIEPVATEYLESGGGPRHFSWDAALNFQWEAEDHRQTIKQYMSEIMKMQRWYAIDRLHHRTEGAARCPGCLLHPPRQVTPDTEDFYRNGAHAASYSSEVSYADSIHHVASKETTPEGPDGSFVHESKKRPRLSVDHLSSSGVKKRKPNPDGAASADDSVTGAALNRAPQPRAPSSYNTLPPGVRTASTPNSTSGFTAINSAAAAAEHKPALNHQNNHANSHPQPQSETQVLTLKDFNLSMRYRGKQWHFQSIAHKARVLELILLHEEQEVESYPVVAFTKGAKKGALSAADTKGDVSLLEDYFRFYTHFMTERFPGNEKLLLQNEVRPSAA